LLKKFATLSEPPTAIFSCNDRMAIGAIHAMHTLGMKIPGDISIVGFDNTPLSRMVFPTLTTIEQPVPEMANLVIDLIMEKIKLNQRSRIHLEEKPDFKRIVLKTRLIIRNSCSAI